MPPTERNGAAGRTPAPGAGRSSRGPAAASSVKVDTADLEKLKRLLGEAATNAETLSKHLKNFDSGPLQTLNQQVQALKTGLARSGVGRGRKSTVSTPSGGTTPTYLPTGQHSTDGGHGTGNGGGSYLTGHWSQDLPVGVGRAAGVAAVEAASGLSTLMASHMQDAVGRSYLLNRWQLASGGSTSYGGQVGLGRNLASMFGNNTLGYNDASQAAATLMSTGVTSGAMGRSRVAGTAFLASLNPTAGAAGGASGQAGLFTPQNYYAARMAGINMMAGGQQNTQPYFDQIINRIDAMNPGLTVEQIQSAMDPGMPLGRFLTTMGITDPDMRQNLVTYWIARHRTGKTGTAALKASGANTGLFKSSQQAANARGQALSSMDVGGMKGMMQGLAAKKAEYQVLGGLADTPFGHTITDATGALSVFSTELKIVNKVLEGFMGYSLAKRVLGGGGVGGGGIFGGGAAGEEEGAATAATGRVAGLLGRGGALLGKIPGVGRLAGVLGRTPGVGKLFGSGLGRMGVGLGLGLASAGWSAGWDHFGHHSTATIGGDALEGAALGSMIGPEGTVVGAGLGAAWGGRKGIEHGVTSAAHWVGSLFGDSNRKTPPLSDNGTTWPQLEKIAQKGPPHVVTSTTRGGHANNSYHYRGQAVDFAAAGGPSADSPGLLAINRYWASKYGRNLKELIYAGPGGICIKDGKVVNGMALYGAPTMAEHHNHVHVAATPASLGGKGGGVPVGAAAGNNAGTDTVGAAPASSSGGYSSSGVSGSLIGGLFSSSSGSSLLAALTSIAGGGVGGYATSAGGGAAAPSATGGGGVGGTGSVPNAPTNIKGNTALARKMAAARGWTGKEWDALYAVWNQESSFNDKASNGSYYGIPQGPIGQLRGKTPAQQITWGLNYIKGRYTDPLGALAHKHQTDTKLGAPKGVNHDQPGGWYETGKWRIIKDEIAQLHRGEMVVPASTAEKLRQAISGPSATGAGGARGSGRAVPVQLVFMVQRGTEAEMRQAARRFAKYVADDHDIELVSSS